MERNEFNSLVAKFDIKQGTQTRFGRTTLKNINTCFYQKDYAKWRLQEIVKAVFSEDELDSKYVSKSFSGAGDRNYPVGQLSSLKKLYLEDSFITPIGVTVFPNGEAFIHPGQTRMLMEDIHSSPVDLMVTYYGESDINDVMIMNRPLGELNLEPAINSVMANYNCRLISTEYRQGSMGDAFWDMVDINTNVDESFTYHEVLGETSLNSEYRHVGIGVNSSMVVEKQYDTILVDGIKLLQRDQDTEYQWSFVPKYRAEMYVFHDEQGNIAGVSRKKDDFDLPSVAVTKSIGTSFLLGYKITDDFIVHDGALMDRAYAFKRSKFNEEINNLNEHHGIQTYMVSMTLTEIQKVFGSPKKPDHITWRLNMTADQLSPDGADVSMTMTELYEFHMPLAKLIFGIGVLHGITEDFSSPIGISLLKEKPKIDPGGTRLMFSDRHTEHLDVVIACRDYNDLKHIQSMGFFPVLHTEYEMKHYDLTIRSSLKTGIRECVGMKALTDTVVYEADRAINGDVVVARKGKYILVDKKIVMELNPDYNWQFYEGD